MLPEMFHVVAPHMNVDELSGFWVKVTIVGV